MDERTENQIEGWDSKPLTGGFAELRELADGGFSGVARAGVTTLFMLNGRVVGVFGGDIEDFDGAEATVYQAPHPSLPLLFAMQEHGGETQAKNYTKDTPISAAHDQLEDAGFTGYIVLSENVLSGDYYVVFYGGRTMSCAFVGNSDRLETGDEAFHLADDEVGIYEVVSVDIEVTDIPGGSGGTSQQEPAAEPDPAASQQGDAQQSGDVGSAAGGERPSSGAEESPASADRPAADDERQPAGGQQTGGGAGGRQSGGGAAGQPTGTESEQPAGGGTPGGPDEGAAGRSDGMADEAREESPSRTRSQAESPGQGEPPADPGQDETARRTDESPPAEDAGRSPAEDAGRSPAEDAGRSPAEDAGRSPAEDAGRSSAEESARADAVSSAEPETSSEEPAASGSTEPERPAGGSTPDREHPRSGSDTVDEPSAGRSTEDAATAPSGAGGAEGRDATTGESPAPREEAAADRAVEAASGPQGSAATGAATTTEGIPKSRASLGDLRPVPSLSPDQTHVAEAGSEAVTRAEDTQTEGSSAVGRADASSSSSSASAAGASRDSAVGSRARNSTASDRGQTGDRSVGSDRPRSGGGTDVTERASQAVDVGVEAGEGHEQVPADAGPEELRRQLAAREERIEDLETAITDLRVQRDGLTDERNRLETEVDRLEAEVDDLEAEVDDLRSQLADDTENKQRLSREDALEGTNLFIRYDSKSGGTLDKAHGSELEREEVNENLRLEHHTQFEAGDVVVEDQPFDEFLGGTVYRGFVEWVVRELLYEIQDTGHVKQLRELYDAIPKIDRAELLGDVSVQFTEDGEQYREQRSFDVVLRDRMGNPLVVANLNDSRNPADREMMETVIQNGIDVKESNESLSSAMMVTSSFFKPGALEAADEAHGGSLLGRDSKESYVKLNRKSGYHLMLVESRDADFHVNVPEL
jgi:hypothetical protein